MVDEWKTFYALFCFNEDFYQATWQQEGETCSHLRVILLKTDEWEFKRSVCLTTSRKLKNNATLSGWARETCETCSNETEEEWRVVWKEKKGKEDLLFLFRAFVRWKNTEEQRSVVIYIELAQR